MQALFFLLARLLYPTYKFILMGMWLLLAVLVVALPQWSHRCRPRVHVVVQVHVECEVDREVECRRRCRCRGQFALLPKEHWQPVCGRC